VTLLSDTHGQFGAEMDEWRGLEGDKTVSWRAMTREKQDLFVK